MKSSSDHPGGAFEPGGGSHHEPNPLSLLKRLAYRFGQASGAAEDLLRESIEIIGDSGYASGGAVSVFGEENAQPSLIVHWGLSPVELRGIEALVQRETLAASMRELVSSRFIDGEPEWIGGEESKALVAVPARGSGRGRGVLWLVTSRPSAAVRADFDLFELVGWQVGMALRNASLEERAQRQVREGDVLFEVSRGITATLDLDALLRLVVESAVKTIPAAEAGVIHLLDPEDGYLHPRALSFLPHIPRDAVGESKMTVGQGVAGQALETGAVVNVSDIASSPGFVPAETGRVFRSLLVAPLIVDGQGIGTLSVDSNTLGAFSVADERLINLLALQAAIAIGNAQLFAELEQTQAQLIQSEKLSALGGLIAGVAHELNNPLTSVLGYAQLLQSTQGLSAEIRRDLDRISAQAQRAAHIVENLLTFARQRKPERTLVDVNDVLQTILDLRTYQLVVNNIQLKTELDDRGLLVLADPNQLQTVALNLINNAQDAIVEYRGSGTLTVTTRLVGNLVRVEVADDGPGIAPEAMGRLFDPFFTTKEVGKGTGLGLSICYGIVTQHGGNIWAESSAGEGATFIVELPVAEREEEAPSEEDRTAPDVPPETRGRILIVDDEPDIIEMLGRAFSDDGYEVDVVGDAQLSLQRIVRARQTGQPYDLVITDIRMPNLDGRELYERLKRTQPDLAERVLFITGDTADPDTLTFLKQAGRRYVTKPFPMEKLRLVVQQVMAGSEQRRGTEQAPEPK